MNVFLKQPVRENYRIRWEEEYFLGMISTIGKMSTTNVLDMAEKQDTMSPATAHKYLLSLVTKKLVNNKRDKEDKRLTGFTLTAKGEKCIEELKHVYARS